MEWSWLSFIVGLVAFPALLAFVLLFALLRNAFRPPIPPPFGRGIRNPYEDYIPPREEKEKK